MLAVGSSANSSTRPIHQRPGHGHPLLLADRQRGRLVREPMRQADALEQIPGPLRVAPLAGERHAQQHVLQRRKPGQQIERLKHEADVPGAEAVAADLGDAGDVGAVDGDPARRRPWSARRSR